MNPNYVAVGGSTGKANWNGFGFGAYRVNAWLTDMSGVALSDPFAGTNDYTALINTVHLSVIGASNEVYGDDTVTSGDNF